MRGVISESLLVEDHQRVDALSRGLLEDWAEESVSTKCKEYNYECKVGIESTVYD
jgi:hypothetical protein